ncbi:hypothetical protein LCGC14_0918530 [marine sediment metagenome]|uniref:1-deoxy-D-xylulose-5-phosphate synthase n=1 Tax=marine sediment metagenome TaxID=412755 RepID=A0A0F9NRL5_9ZZZZ
MSLLGTISGPKDLKELSPELLPELAGEIRQLIIDTVDKNGGHMASNLGVVELTIALHRLFESPRDRIIFDTSHQCYTHKILTGRAAGFGKIRTQGGYSGFFEPSESEHDLTVIGHAGTGPSLALGCATGESLRGGKGYTVGVIGDGSLTSGIAYEGLSNIAAQQPGNLMIILNDNGMSISENVGWIALWRNRWLGQLRNRLDFDPDFQTFEKSVENLASKIPGGILALGLGRGLKSSIRKAIIPDIGSFWTEMGFNYIGPVDGHNLAELEKVINQATNWTGKVPFVHVLTHKGLGHKPAEADPVRFHQPGSIPTGKTYSEIFSNTLGEMMERDSSIVAISAAMMTGTSLVALKTRFPDRVFDVGICEQHAVSMASGMARAGLRPVVCLYSTFLQRAFDQIVHDVCLNSLPVVFGIDRAGLVGQDGKTHHGVLDMAFMRIPPNMVVSVPRDENQLRRLLFTALTGNKPFSIRYPRGQVQGVPLDKELQPITIESEYVRDGEKICLVAVGPMVQVACQAAEELSKSGIDPAVLDLRFVKPIDIGAIKTLMKFTKVLVLEEGTSEGGIRSAILEELSTLKGWPDSLMLVPTIPVVRRTPEFRHISCGDTFIEHGIPGDLRKALGLTTEAIVKEVTTWMT